jgi:protease-4
MRDFLKHTLATLLGILIFLGLSVGGLIALILLLASRDSVPAVKDRSVLLVDLAQPLTDGPRSPSTLSQALSDSQSSIQLRTFVTAIDQAAKDSRIVGIYLYNSRSSGNPTGFATLKEAREALQRFRASGKRLIAYDMDWTERTYYLASTADAIAINPMGSMELNGLSSQPIFFSGFLQKYGIDVQVTRVGRYKSAVEPFLLNQLSPENRQQTQTLLQDIWNEFLKATGEARNKTPQQLQAIANQQTSLLAADAVKQGLVDRQAYQDEIIDELKKLTDSKAKDKNFRQISLRNYARVVEARQDTQRSRSRKIAVLYADGDIVNGQGEAGSIGGDRFARELRQIRQDESVKAVVLRVNSPGGSATASEVIQREVILTRKVKPVIVSMGSVAASGGYWISTYSDRIFAEPNTITGSIGVFGIQPNIRKLANDNGITWDSVKTGQFADSQTITRPKTPQELAQVQKIVDHIYDQFLDKVAESRKLDRAKVAEIAQGRVWSGIRAKQLGLVDELGGLQTAIQAAAKKADLGDNWQVEEYPKLRGLEERIFGGRPEQILARLPLLKPGPEADLLTREVIKLQTELALLNNFNDPRGIYARLPFSFWIE